MEPTTMSVDKKETQEVAKKNQKEEINELTTHGQSDDEEGVHGTQCDSNNSFNFDDNTGTENAELSRKLQEALRYRNWELAGSLVMGSNMYMLNEALCMSLGCIWILSTREELNGVTTLIKKIVSSGASKFSSAALRSSFLASCVFACQNETMSLGRTLTFVEQRINDCVKECNDTECVKELGNKVLKLTDRAMEWIEKHQGSSNRPKIFSLSEIELQLTAFKTFLDLAENRLTISDFAVAFDAACFPLNLYSYTFYPGWASGTPAAAVRGLLNLLVDRGADNVNECLLEASRYGTTELVLMLLQIARRNNLLVNVDLALSIAAFYSKFDTMNCLVDEGQATVFLTPLRLASLHGCIPVISWCINRGCSDMELCFALTSAVSSNQHESVIFLLSKVSLNVMTTLSRGILKSIAEEGCGSFDGVAFLLSANFLGSPEATYGVVETLIDEEDERFPELTTYLKNNWSLTSFYKGMRDADDHYVNVMRVLRRGCSRIQLRELPSGMVVAIALIPLYRECLKVKGELMPQRLKGELVGSLNRLGYREAQVGSTKGELLTMLERHLPSCHHS